MDRETQKLVLAELKSMLPENYDSEMIIPEIKTPLHIDEQDWSKGVMKIEGDVSHIKRAGDNPIVEIFRSASVAYNGNRPKAEKFLFSPLFPTYDAATGITTCEFYANNISQAIKDIGEEEAKKRVREVLIDQIGQTFQDALKKYFRDPKGFRKYQKFQVLLDYARDVDEFELLVSKAKSSIKSFILDNDLPLPKKRANGA